jgi:hypothetical protein
MTNLLFVEQKIAVFVSDEPEKWNFANQELSTENLIKG